MKPRRLILTVAPFTCVLLVAAFVYSQRPVKPPPIEDGERFNVATLAPGEEILVRIVFSHIGT